MFGFKGYYESLKILHVVNELLDLDLPKYELQMLSFFGVKTFEDFLDFCRDSQAIRAFLLHLAYMKTGQIPSAHYNGWKTKRARLECFSRVFDLLVEEHENSGLDSADTPVDIRKVDYVEYHKLKASRYYDLPKMRSKSSKVFELPPELRPAATKFSNFWTVVPTAIDAPKSPLSRIPASTSLPKVETKENAAPQPELSVTSPVDSKLASTVGNSVVAPTKVDLPSPKSLLPRSSSLPLVPHVAKEENAAAQVKPSCACIEDSRFYDYVENSVERPTKVDLASP